MLQKVFMQPQLGLLFGTRLRTGASGLKRGRGAQ
jgi:hypothetical protein